MSETITALTIYQPWAWAIMEGPKRFENRSWYSRHRGPLLIHAGKSRKSLGAIQFLRDAGHQCPDESDLVFGAILGVVGQVGCVRPSAAICEGDIFAEGPWCHVYRHPRKLSEPVQYRGQQGYFQVPADVAEHLLCWADLISEALG